MSQKGRRRSTHRSDLQSPFAIFHHLEVMHIFGGSFVAGTYVPVDEVFVYARISIKSMHVSGMPLQVNITSWARVYAEYGPFIIIP